MTRIDLPVPVRMQRIAVATPIDGVREVLVDLAERGTVELAGELPPPSGAAAESLQRLAGTVPPQATPALSALEPDIQALESGGARDLLAGEVELDRRRQQAIQQDDVAVFVGWTPSDEIPELRRSMEGRGVAVVELPAPPELPPTLLQRTKLAGPFRMLVDTYGVLPYSDVDPTAFAAVAFVVMFGMMFGDVGHGGLLVVLGLALGRIHQGPLAAFRSAWPLLVAAGAAGAFFGLLYGEFFGPTGLVPTLWLAPLEEPLPLLKAAVVVGSVLLSISYLLGFANRWRESGPASALYSEGGLAGGLVFAGIALAALGWSRNANAATLAGGVTALVGLVLVFVGTISRTNVDFAGITRATVEVLDTGIRVGSNIISFTRLAAFGLMHAALSLVTLEAAQRFASAGPLGWALAVIVFIIGTLVALALEGVVASIQALRLEYYEIFSRMFAEEGRPFAPFAIPVRKAEDRA